MKFAACVILLLAVTMCSAQQSSLVSTNRRFVIKESPTITLQELQQRNQSKARGTFADAKMAARRGDHVRSIKLFEKVLQKDPLFSDARNDLAVEMIVAGETERAIDELQQVVHLNPHFLMAYTNLGVLLCNEKKFPEAESVLRRALGINPNSAKASLLLALALYGQGKRGAETQTSLEAAARSDPQAVKLLKKWFGVSDLADTSMLGKQAILAPVPIPE